MRALCFYICHSHRKIIRKQIHTDPIHGSAHILRSGLDPVIMIADQPCDCLYGIVVKLQPAHDLSGDLFTDQGMAFEMIPPVLICRLHRRFPHIMEQHGETEDLIPLDIFQGMECVIRHIIFMVRRILHDTDHSIPFRKNDLCDPEHISILDPLRVGRYKKLHQFSPDPLRTDVFQRRRQFSHRCCRILLDREIKLRRESDRPQDAERVFRKPLLRISHAADPVPVQILHPAKHIHQPDFIIICHRIDGKVPAPQVLLKTVRKAHLLRVSAVLIRPVDAVCGHLKAVLPQKHRDRAVLDPRIYRLPEQLLYLLGLC